MIVLPRHRPSIIVLLLSAALISQNQANNGQMNVTKEDGLNFPHMDSLHDSSEQTNNHTQVSTAETYRSFSQSSVQADQTGMGDFIEDLTLWTDDIIDCVRASAVLDFNVTRGTISLEYSGTGAPSPMYSCTIQLTAPSTKVLHVNILELAGPCMCRTFHMSIYDGVRYGSLETTAGPCEGLEDKTASHVFTFTEKAVIIIMMPLSSACTARLNFTAVPESARPQLEMKFLSPYKGYVQTPRFDGQTPYPPNMDSWVRVNVPEHHAVLTSFAHLQVRGVRASCRRDSVSMYVGGDQPDNMEWTACSDYRPLPSLYEVPDFLVRFVSDSHVSQSGFRLLFSFHNHTALPEMLPDGKWNCSVPYFADFQQHFRCDLHQDCAGAEDESDCSYTSEACGPGLISLGDRCYKLLMQEAPISWSDASIVCRLAGGHLVSLNTLEEWRDVTGLLKTLSFRVFIGFTSASPVLPHMYQHFLQWTDASVAYFLPAKDGTGSGECGYFKPPSDDFSFELATVSVGLCFNDDIQLHALCEMGSGSATEGKLDDLFEIELPTVAAWTSNVSRVKCPTGHVTHDFLSCDMQSACWGRGYGSSAGCNAPMTPLPPSFTCTNGIENVPYTLVCDFRSDCRDDSDEDFCVFPPCDVIAEFSCGNLQCVPSNARCDRVEQCVNGADEKRCTSFSTELSDIWPTPPPPARIDFDGRGTFSVLPLNATDLSCPPTHFQCPGDGYCLPVYVRCNGVYDCPGKEDEAACDSYTCPGFYRCRASRICLHPEHVCDGVSQCPQRDDELVCGLDCPENCTCYGLAFYCQRRFPAHEHQGLRYLDARGSGMNLEDFVDNRMLIYLSLADCGLEQLHAVDLPNMHSLDLSYNGISMINVDDLVSFHRLMFLSLSGNPLTRPFLMDTNRAESISRVKILDFSHVDLAEIDVSIFSAFPEVQMMNFSESGIQRVSGQGFQILKDLRQLDLRGCPLIEFPRDIFKGLDHLESVYADNYKLCCQETLPAGFNLPQCRAPTDEISSCDALLRSDFYRVLLAVFSVLALLGNLGSFVYRVLISKTKTDSGFKVFVTHLCVSDFLMGVYLGVIGVADRVFQGTYLWRDVTWKSSAACQLAGFLSLLSSEVSAFIICLITLDRFLVLRFPFSSFRFHTNSAHVVCVLAWLVGIVLAGLPLLPMTSHWEFYSQSGICIPLPITRKDFPGHDYSFAIMIVLNFVLFLLIAAGQVSIFWSIRANSMSMCDVSTSKSKDLTIARRLFTVVMSDFLCWFPIGLLGLLASNGVAVPGEVNVVMAIIVLPLNSALNPFLYTVNAVMERRRQTKEKRWQQRLSQAQKLNTITTVTERTKPTYTQ